MAIKVDLKKHFLKTYRTLPKTWQKLPFFLAVSSGLDSSVLAHLLLSLRKELPLLYWLHVNYHLRVPDSDREEKFLKQWAAKEKVPLFVKSLQPPKQIKNLQNWAREQRYRFFVESIKKETKGRGLLLTAHHQLDQVETLLSRLLMGSGLKALRGMEVWEESEHWSKTVQDSSKNPLKIFRPFLTVPREALEIYAKAHRVKFCEDSSNQSLKYLRNRLRHELWPKILQENPQAASSLTQISKRAAAAYDALEPAARRWLQRHQKLNRKGRGAALPGPELVKLPFGKRQIVLELFLRQFFTKTRNLGKSLQTIEECLDKNQTRHGLPLPLGFEWEWSPAQLVIRQKKKIK